MNTGGQQAQLPPVIKRVVPEGHDYRIVIPENVEHIIRKFCDKAPDNEWSGTLFYEFEGDFNSPSFKIICKDFFLMDLGSGAFTEFDEDGTSIDYMAQHPELMSCHMGLCHSHNKMSAFFSGTDVNTLRAEGFDRNNFVSLIVNNDGTYAAAITRKVTYTERHNIEITGKYPFFGTKRVLELPVTNTTDEKTKVVIEYFDLIVEKTPVTYSPDEYDRRFAEIAVKKLRPNNTPQYPQSQGSLVRNFHVTDDDDDNYGYPYTQGCKADTIKEALKENKFEQGVLFEDEDVFDTQFVQDALAVPVLEYKLNELMLQIVTGCPVITKWVKAYEIKNELYDSIFENYKIKGVTATFYQGLVSSYLENIFIINEPEDYFPKYLIDQAKLSAYELENILIIKLLKVVFELEANDYTVATIEALKDFYSL